MKPGRTVTGALVLSAVLALGSSCSLVPSRPSGPCPSTWDAMVTWSGREAYTEIQFYDGAALVDRLPIDVQGASLDDPMIMHDGKASFVALGNTVYDKTTIVTVDLTSCQITMNRIEQKSILQQSVAGDQLFTSSGLNNVGHLTVNDLATGARVADVETPGAESMGVTVDNDHVYAFSRNDDEPGTKLLTIDRSSWQITDRFEVSDLQLSVSDAALVGGKIYFAASDVRENSRPLDYLGVLDLRTKKVTRLKLPHPMPYQIEVDPTGERLYIAHTFMNDSLDPYESYRYVTRLELATAKMTTIDTGPRLGPISVSSDGSRLLALHANYDDAVTGRFSVTTLDATRRTTSTDIVRHQGDRYFYLASVTAR